MKWERVLRYILLGGVFLIPFIPLIVMNSMYFPFITGKAFAFRILVEIMLAAWIVLALYDSRYRPRGSAILFAFAAFLIIIGLADAFGENPFKSFWSNFERMEGFITLLHLFAYFIVTTVALNTAKLWRAFWNTSIGVSVIIAIYGIFQLLGFITINQGGVRLDGTFGNATYLAVYMLFHVFIALMLLMPAKERMVQYLYGIAIFLELVALYFTATRGAILGLVGGLLVTAVMLAIWGKDRPRLRKSALVGLVSLLVIVGGFFALKNTPIVEGSPVLSRIASISLSEGDTRFTIWNMALQGAKERPLLGWGQENFNYVFNKYYEPSLYDQEPWFDRVHNIFLDWLIAGGVLGLLAYLSLFLTALYLLIWRGSVFTVAEKAVIIGLFAGYGFHNLFVFDNLVSYILFVSVLAYIHVRTRSSESAVQPLALPAWAKAGGSIAAVLVIAAMLYSFNVLPMRGAHGLLVAISPQQEGLRKNHELFQEALALDTFGNQEIREQLMQGTGRLAGNQEAPTAVKRDLLNLTRAEMDMMFEEVPDDARLRLLYGSTLAAHQLHDEASEQLEHARELSPTKQAILFELGSVRLEEERYDEALQLFKEAYELDTSYPRAQVMYIVGAIYAGEQALADELTSELFIDGVANHDRVVQAYYDVGRMHKVVEIWEYRVAQSPNNPQYHLSLGAAYLAAERRQDAIAEIEEAIRLNPEFKEQGERYIEEIRAGRNP